MHHTHKHSSKLLVAAILTGLWSSLAFGEMGGGYTGSSYRYGTNAREIALAGATIADSNQGFRALSNPAAITALSGYELGTSLFGMSLDRSIQVLSVGRNLPPKGAAALTYFRSGTTNIQGRDLQGNPTGLMDVHDSYGMLSFGLKLTTRVRAGINIKAFFNDINGDISGKGIGADLGVLVTAGRKLAIGGMLSNLGGKTTWNSAGGGVEEILPKGFSLGLSYMPFQNLHLLGQYEGLIADGRSAEGEFRLGAESLFYERIFFRGGIVAGNTAGTSGTKKINLDYSLGFGIVYPVWKLNDLHFDYAIDPGNRGEGLSHLLSWSFTI